VFRFRILRKRGCDVEMFRTSLHNPLHIVLLVVGAEREGISQATLDASDYIVRAHGWICPFLQPSSRS